MAIFIKENLRNISIFCAFLLTANIFYLAGVMSGSNFFTTFKFGYKPIQQSFTGLKDKDFDKDFDHYDKDSIDKYSPIVQSDNGIDNQRYEQDNGQISSIIHKQRNTLTEETKDFKTRNDGFQVLNTKSVSTLEFVCIAPLNEKPSSHTGRNDKRIHMYESKTTKTLHINGYEIQTFKGTPSFKYSVNRNVAYFFGFVAPFRPNNFFHFTRQIYFPLHYLINKTNTITSKLRNDVYFKVPLENYNKSVYAQYLFPSLNIRSDYGMIHNFTHVQHNGNVCYRNAVFSSDLHLDYAKQAISYFYKFLNVKQSMCDITNSIVLIQRKYSRQILNANELITTAKNMRFTNISMVVFENIPLRLQAKTIYCASVLVGVQGAGMQWAYFMKPNSVAIEIAWPHFGWDLYYSIHQSKEEALAKYITFIPLITSKVQNVTTCWKGGAKVHHLTPAQMSVKPIESIYQTLKHLQLGKSCRVSVDATDFSNALRTAFRFLSQSH